MIPPRLLALSHFLKYAPENLFGAAMFFFLNFNTASFLCFNSKLHFVPNQCFFHFSFHVKLISKKKEV